MPPFVKFAHVEWRKTGPALLAKFDVVAGVTVRANIESGDFLVVQVGGHGVYVCSRKRELTMAGRNVRVFRSSVHQSGLGNEPIGDVESTMSTVARYMYPCLPN